MTEAQYEELRQKYAAAVAERDKMRQVLVKLVLWHEAAPTSDAHRELCALIEQAKGLL
jgi:hypothetical protein